MCSHTEHECVLLSEKENFISSQREDRERARTVLDSRSFRGRVSGEWKDEGPAGAKTKLKLVRVSTQQAHN